MTPDISVIIPTYRRPGPLAEAIESVLAQQGAACEILVVDDCPERSAEAVARRFAGRGVTYLHTAFPSRGRPALVRNQGFKSARADIIHFLDDDDLAPEGLLCRGPGGFRAAPGYRGGLRQGRAVRGCRRRLRARLFRRRLRRARRYSRLGPKLGFAAAMFFQQTLLICSAGMVRRSCVEAIGGFDLEPSLAEDVDFFARAIRHSGAVVLDRTSIHYRIGPSLMRLPDRQPLIESSYRSIHERYRREHGAVDYFALKTFARILDRLHA